jgi:hypothetical protein
MRPAAQDQNPTPRRWHFVLSRRAQDILNEMTEADCAFLAEIPEMPKKERRQRSTWTPDEDQKLLQLVTDLGQGNWPNIAYHLPGRQPKQCRDRFVNKLDPNLKKGGWTGEEDKMIVAAHMRLGNRWHEMAKAIAGRSELQIKDRWYAVVQPKADMIAKDLTGASPASENRLENAKKPRLFPRFWCVFEVRGGAPVTTFETMLVFGFRLIFCELFQYAFIISTASRLFILIQTPISSAQTSCKNENKKFAYSLPLSLSLSISLSLSLSISPISCLAPHRTR